MKVSLIVLTYNWPEALELVLRALMRQTVLPFEVIVADDGSRPDTRELLLRLARDYPVPLRYVWQEDSGFRASRARNSGILAAQGDYVILLDGDMVTHPRFIADHLMLAQRGSFIQGTRLRVTDAETARLLAGGKPHFHPWIDAYYRPADAVASQLNYGKRIHALRLPWLARLKARSRKGGHVMSCNMAIWRDDLLRVNGFNEAMEGYGSEDLELAARLQNAGLRRRQLKFAGLAIHLEHRSRAPGDPDDPTMPNNIILRRTRQEGIVRCALGIAEHEAEPGSPVDLR
ncbi:glycosyltransferase family 2 protein [Dyella tabacisoli]|uniref:Glycosyltransferase n=1 Tax=Dyella tabacisoli TaxID=2282381 RepID=A0A369UQ78_9GAMM|nr:glycosyltransferase family 2 protein [Dyella tabacisoli]RDD82205.1 glycosyltransferase [Dyella tabacisoli]